MFKVLRDYYDGADQLKYKAGDTITGEYFIPFIKEVRALGYIDYICPEGFELESGIRPAPLEEHEEKMLNGECKII